MRFVNILWSAFVYVGTCAILYNRRWDEKRKARFSGGGTTGEKVKAPSVAKTTESLISLAPLPTIEEKPDVEFKMKLDPSTPVKSARPRVQPTTQEPKKTDVDFKS